MSSSKRMTVAVPRSPDSAFQHWMSLKPNSTPSEIMRDTAERYLAVVRESLPDLDILQWCCVIDALGAVWRADDSYAWILAEVVSIEIDERDLDRKWSVDRQRLQDVIAGFSFAQLIAVGEMTQAFWQSHPKEDYEGILASIRERMSIPPKSSMGAFEGRMWPKREMWSNPVGQVTPAE